MPPSSSAATRCRVGACLAADPTVSGAYRVLNSEGTDSSGFRRPDGSDRPPPREVLEGEGVRFDPLRTRPHVPTPDGSAEPVTLLGEDVPPQ
ncbi:hypothetical protein AB0890_28110 [Streptomyces sp. NPDC005406]|uniref:hypothetical protein n=1 Tax=Streptomyces sp. NPDC005406 TaxID=3155339 RepID=UPI0034566E96